MLDVFAKTNRVYVGTLDLIVYFSIFILLSLILLPLISSFVSVGGGFLRFSSLYLDITPAHAIIFIFIGLISTLCLAFFVSALVSIVKLRETLDHVAFSKAAAIFPRYVTRVFTFLLFLSILSIAAGTILDFANVPGAVTHLIMFCLWLPFIFTPQVIVIEDFKINEALIDSIRFVKRNPLSLVAYIILGMIMMSILLLIETGLGQYFIWEHKIVSIILVSLFVLPYLQMFATELYIRRYPITRV